MSTLKNILFIVIVLTAFYFTYTYLDKNTKPYTVNFQNKISETDTSDKNKFLFTGDVMLGRYVETLMNNEGDNYPFQNIKFFLRDFITIINLEGSVPENHIATKNGGFRFSFTEKVANTLLFSGVSAVSLANNHMNDWGSSGYENTKKVLSENKIKYFGNYEETSEDVFIDKLDSETRLVIYGINVISTSWDLEKAKEVTTLLRKKYSDDYLVAFVHWGNEYKHKQSAYQQKLAYQILDLGVDAIIGSHPHVIQGVEIYNNKPIFYSLGNFIFDQYFSKAVQEGYLLSLEKNGNIYFYKIFPIKSERSVPRLATQEEKEEILELIKNNSTNIYKDDIEELLIIK